MAKGAMVKVTGPAAENLWSELHRITEENEALRADLAAARELARVRGEAITAYVDARTVIGAEPSDYEESEPAVRAYKRLCVLAATPAPEDALVAERDALRAALVDAAASLALIRQWSARLRPHEPTEAANLLFADFWSFAEGWDCDLGPRIEELLGVA